MQITLSARICFSLARFLSHSKSLPEKHLSWRGVMGLSTVPEWVASVYRQRGIALSSLLFITIGKMDDFLLVTISVHSKLVFFFFFFELEDMINLSIAFTYFYKIIVVGAHKIISWVSYTLFQKSDLVYGAGLWRWGDGSVLFRSSALITVMCASAAAASFFYF